MRRWAFPLLFLYTSVYTNTPEPFFEFIGIDVTTKSYKKKVLPPSIHSVKPFNFLSSYCYATTESTSYPTQIQKPDTNQFFSVIPKLSLSTFIKPKRKEATIHRPQYVLSNVPSSFSFLPASKISLSTPSAKTIAPSAKTIAPSAKTIAPSTNTTPPIALQKIKTKKTHNAPKPCFSLDTVTFPMINNSCIGTAKPLFPFLYNDFITINIDVPSWDIPSNPYQISPPFSPQNSQNTLKQSPLIMNPLSCALSPILNEESSLLEGPTHTFFEHSQPLSVSSSNLPKTQVLCELPTPHHNTPILTPSSNTSTQTQFYAMHPSSNFGALLPQQTFVLHPFTSAVLLPISSFLKSPYVFSFTTSMHPPLVSVQPDPLFPHQITNNSPSPLTISLNYELKPQDLYTECSPFSRLGYFYNLNPENLILSSISPLHSTHTSFGSMNRICLPQEDVASLVLVKNKKAFTISNQTEQCLDHIHAKQLNINQEQFLVLLPNLNEDPFSFNRHIPLSEITLLQQTLPKEFFHSLNESIFLDSYSTPLILQYSASIFGCYTPQHLTAFFTSPLLLPPLDNHKNHVINTFCSPDLLNDATNLCKLPSIINTQYSENINKQQRKTKNLLRLIPSPHELQTHNLSDGYFTESKVIENKKEGTYIFKTTLRPQPDPKTFSLPHTITFLIDQSHSVGIKDYETFKKGVISALNYLDKKAKFNIVLLGNTDVPFCDVPVKANKKQIQKAQIFLKNRKIGTVYGRKNPYLLSETIQSLSKNPHTLNTFIYLTNNVEMHDVSREVEKASRWVAIQNQNFDFHIATIHKNENSAILSMLSKLGKGSFSISKTFASFPRRLCILVKKMKTPLLQNVSITPVPKPNQKIRLYLSQQISPNIYETKPYSIYGSTNTLEDIDLYIQGMVGENIITVRKSVSLKEAKSGSLSFFETVKKKRSQLDTLRFLQTMKCGHLKLPEDLFQPSSDD